MKETDRVLVEEIAVIQVKDDVQLPEGSVWDKNTDYRVPLNKVQAPEGIDEIFHPQYQMEPLKPDQIWLAKIERKYEVVVTEFAGIDWAI